MAVRGEPSGAGRLCVGAGIATAGANALLILSLGLARPAPSAPLLAVYAGLVAVASGLEAALAPPAERATETSAARWPARASGLLLMAVWLGSPLLATSPPDPWRFALGSIAFAAGAALRAVAIRRLGARFNSDNHIEADAALETHGLYRRLAHPSELGLLLLAAGAALFWGTATLWMIPALYLATLARLTLEEAALSRRHGARYALYRRSTFDPFPRLTPQGGARP